MDQYIKDIDTINKNYATYRRLGKGIQLVFMVRYNQNNEIEFVKDMYKIHNFSNSWYVRSDAGNITKQEFDTELERAIKFLKE